MFDNPEKLFILFVIALMIFGPSKLASLGASLGRSIRDFRSAVRGAHDEFRSAVQEHVDSLAPALPAPEPMFGDTPPPAVDYGTDMSTTATPGADTVSPAGAAATAADPAHAAAAATTPALTEDDPASLASEPTAAALRESLSR
ncbi:MAG TPA: twin-arginine translocase TatA/TatE family subunit [bacterium]|nr:twin-arginine translocase TatA/TatE family subunit [bacterium]